MSSRPAIPVERRETPRVAVELDARVFPGATPGTIVDLSTGGARLRMDDPPATGADVVVVEWSSGRAHDGQVVWSLGQDVGVRFIRTCLLEERAPVALAGVKAHWEAYKASPG